MFLLLAVLVGILYACGIYLLLARSTVRLVFGLVLLSHATHLLIFTAAGPVRGRAPVIPADQTTLPAGSADPLPQALVLTAIVISFGVLSFTSVLVKRLYAAVGTDDSDQMTEGGG